MDKTNKDSALRPDYFAEFPSLTDPIERKDEKQPVDPEEGALYAISHSEGWKLIEGYIQGLKEELDAMVLQLMNAGASFEEIGQKTIVKEVTKAYLDRVLGKVQTAREALEQPNG